MSDRDAWTVDPVAAFTRPSSEQRLDAILRLATQMFNQYGMAGTTLDDLAARLGIRKPSLYNYIASKNDLIYQCLMRTVRVRSAVMDVAEKARGKVIDRLAVYLDEFMRALWDPPGMFPLMSFYEYPPGYRESPEGEASEPVVRAELGRLLTMFERGIKDGSVRKANPDLLVHAFESPFFGLTRWYRPDALTGRDNPTTLNEFVIDGMSGREIHTTLNTFIIEGLRRRN
jgi:AcrR family transcriptional regulator